MDDDEILKTGYEAASATYGEITNRNAAIVINGGSLTIEDSRREDAAEQTLAILLRLYLESLPRLSHQELKNAAHRFRGTAPLTFESAPDATPMGS